MNKLKLNEYLGMKASYESCRSFGENNTALWCAMVKPNGPVSSWHRTKKDAENEAAGLFMEKDREEAENEAARICMETDREEHKRSIDNIIDKMSIDVCIVELKVLREEISTITRRIDALYERLMWSANDSMMSGQSANGGKWASEYTPSNSLVAQTSGLSNRRKPLAGEARNRCE